MLPCTGFESESQAYEISKSVGMSKVPPGIGLNLELIMILCKYKLTE